MAFKTTSNWNEKSELEALLIFKQLEKEKFPKGMQIKLCRDMSKKYNLSERNISAKVGNYKSVAGINNSSHASKDTKENYKNYKDSSIEDINFELKNLYM